VTNLVASYTPGGNRNDFGIYAGMQFVPSVGMTVSQLGCRMATGNTSMTVVLTDAPGATILASAVVSFSGGTVGNFYYAPISPSISLASGTAYCLFGEVSIGGPSWADSGPVTLNGVSSVTAAAADGPGGTFLQNPNQSYVGVDLVFGSSAPISLSDSLAASDGLISVAAPVHVTLNDGIVASDTFSPNATGPARLTDALTPNDAISSAATLHAVTSDTAAASDVLASITASARALTDSLTPTDAVSPAATLHAVISDTPAASDTLTSAAAPAAYRLADTVAVVDTLQSQANSDYVFSLVDTPSVSDRVSSAVSIPARWADGLSAADGISSTIAAIARWIDGLSPADHLAYVNIVSAAIGSRARRPRAAAATVVGSLVDVAMAGRTLPPRASAAALFSLMDNVRVAPVPQDIRTVSVPKI
jgi:hypothetical protein